MRGSSLVSLTGGAAMGKMPAVFINHGGGPMPLYGKQPDVRASLARYGASLSPRPRAVLVVTAHWESGTHDNNAATVSVGEAPSLLYDYGGFPRETYAYKYPAPGSPEVARRVVDLLRESGIPTRTDAVRGWDHGVFVPMMCMFEDADVPVVQLSLYAGQDARAHVELGEALAPLRGEGVLVVGSGAGFHNFALFGSNAGRAASVAFGDWLEATATLPTYEARKAAILDWRRLAPAADEAHPLGAAEHLMPALVVFGCGRDAEAARVLTEPPEKAPFLTGFKFAQFDFR